jgi:hypothetical protein
MSIPPCFDTVRRHGRKIGEETRCERVLSGGGNQPEPMVCAGRES